MFFNHARPRSPHQSRCGGVGLFSSSCFCFVPTTPLPLPLYDKDDRFPWGNLNKLLSASMCCIISTSAAPALLQSWQEGALIATANSSRERPPPPLSFPFSPQVMSPFKELIVSVRCLRGILGSWRHFSSFTFRGVA